MIPQLSPLRTTGVVTVMSALLVMTLACPIKWQPPRQNPRPTTRPTTARPTTAGPPVSPTARIFYMSTSITDPIRDWDQAAAACQTVGLSLTRSISEGNRISRINEFLDRLEDIDGTFPDAIGFWRWSETAESGVSCPAVVRNRSTNETLYDAMVDCSDLLHGFICDGSIDLNMAATMGSIWCDGVCAIFFE